MKATNRVVIGASGILILLIILLARHLLDLGNQYSAFTYFRTSLAKTFFQAPSNDPPAIGVEAGDKVVIMAKMETEDTNWVIRELPSFVTTHHIFFLLWAIISNIHLTRYLAGNTQSTSLILPRLRLQTQTTHSSHLWTKAMKLWPTWPISSIITLPFPP